MQRHRDASGRLCFHAEMPASRYEELLGDVTGHFGLSPVGKRVDGLDVMFQDFGRDGRVVGLEWDHWLCFTVVAKTPESEGLVEEIARYLTRPRREE